MIGVEAHNLQIGVFARVGAFALVIIGILGCEAGIVGAGEGAGGQGGKYDGVTEHGVTFVIVCDGVRDLFFLFSFFALGSILSFLNIVAGQDRIGPDYKGGIGEPRLRSFVEISSLPLLLSTKRVFVSFQILHCLINSP